MSTPLPGGTSTPCTTPRRSHGQPHSQADLRAPGGGPAGDRGFGPYDLYPVGRRDGSRGRGERQNRLSHVLEAAGRAAKRQGRIARSGPRTLAKEPSRPRNAQRGGTTAALQLAVGDIATVRAREQQVIRGLVRVRPASAKRASATSERPKATRSKCGLSSCRRDAHNVAPPMVTSPNLSPLATSRSAFASGTTMLVTAMSPPRYQVARPRGDQLTSSRPRVRCRPVGLQGDEEVVTRCEQDCRVELVEGPVGDGAGRENVDSVRSGGSGVAAVDDRTVALHGGDAVDGVQVRFLDHVELTAVDPVRVVDGKTPGTGERRGGDRWRRSG